jgi:type II secretory pathway pseudopilin PulG
MRRARDEDGFVMISAILLLTVILGLGLGLLLFADNQQKASTREQATEAAFNVAEAALNAQIGQLSRQWPTLSTEMPRSCESGSVKEEGNDCPSPTDLKVDPNTGSTSCSGTDAWSSPLTNQWTTYVRRATEGSLFSSTKEYEQLSYASSDEGELWVRAVGVVQCHPVAVISLVSRLRVTLLTPEDAIVGNWFKVTNKGNKTIVNRQGNVGNSGEAGPVSMRCESPPGGICEEYEESKEQVSPPITEHPKSSSVTYTSSQLATFKSEAQAHGTYYSATSPYHCPTSMSELEGVKLSSSSSRAPVYVEGCENLKIKANGEANCTPSKPTEPESPGFLVIANGTLELSGTSSYCGVIYAANLQKSSEAIIKLQGGTVVVGGIIVDGSGGIEFGSSGQGGNPANLVFDTLAFHDLTISAGAAATRNSFRVLPAGQ